MMKKSPYYIFLVLPFIIILMAILYGFHVISAWKLAVLTMAAAVYSIIDVVIEQRLYRNRTRNMKELLLLQQKLLSNEKTLSETEKEFIAALSKVRDKGTNTTSFWAIILPYFPLVLLIIGLSIDKDIFDSGTVNIISALGVAISSISIFQQKEVGKQIPMLENDLIQISDRILRGQEGKNQ